jgi:glutamate-1-semialdehyde aminotransferase
MNRKNKGAELWKAAKKIIPGGSQLLSKRSEMFLPEYWPAYYKKAKGVDIWDLDGKRYIDMSLMGIGSCILGYADEDVNKVVKEAINFGSMTTLNCPEEIELAEILIRLNPWASMVRFARTGGEAMAIAVRIARAYAGKDKIAFCGYHGWHDWYLAANLADDANLDGHLLPGLKPVGVPRGLKGTSIPFSYNKIDELEAIIEKHDDIGAIVMEPIRNHQPEDGFLEKVRRIADELDAVLVFDEITSGWRMNVGGAHRIYKVYPDIAVYGKAMSNGFPMAAIVGKKNIMDAAQESFISSTYWTEKVGFAAALATINKMRDKDVPEHLEKIGKKLQDEWERTASAIGVEIEVFGIYPLSHFEFKENNPFVLKTLFTQLMLEKGFLASTGFYASYAHNDEHVGEYSEALDDTFKFISRSISEGNPMKYLQGPVCHAGFKRLI